jgi:uncharacterized protein (DUF983 family)
MDTALLASVSVTVVGATVMFPAMVLGADLDFPSWAGYAVDIGMGLVMVGGISAALIGLTAAWRFR